MMVVILMVNAGNLLVRGVAYLGQRSGPPSTVPLVPYIARRLHASVRGRFSFFDNYLLVYLFIRIVAPPIQIFGGETLAILESS